MSPEQLSAYSALTSVVITTLVALAALLQLRAYVREQRDRARPFVIVDFDVNGDLLLVRIQNPSPTIASNVRLIVTPLIPRQVSGRQ